MRIPRFPYLPLLFGLCFGTLLTLGLISTGAVASPLPSEVIVFGIMEVHKAAAKKS